MSVFRRWLEGEADYPLLDGWREAPPKTKKPAPKKRDDRKELRGFLRVYAVCAVILCAVLILFAVAFGRDSVRAFFTRRVFNALRITGLMLYAVMFGVYVFLGANGIDSELSRYLVLVIDLAVGLVVMSTMYGFFALYAKGEL